MQRSELIKKTAEVTEESPNDIEAMLNALIDIIAETVASGESVNVMRFGRFEPRYRKSYSRPNPMTGKSMDVPERTNILFVASPLLKEKINS